MKTKSDLICVTKTIDKEFWLAYPLKKVIEACRLVGCDNEMIQDCTDGMKCKEIDCLECYVMLCNELEVKPERITV